jgi:hypothetical protein
MSRKGCSRKALHRIARDPSLEEEPMMRRILTMLLLSAPAAALGFEAVDTLPFSSRFPAYEAPPEHPREFWAEAGFLRDNNVLRRPGGSADETITRLGVGARTDTRVFGRQRLRLEANAYAYAFERFPDLDHVAYGVLGEWGWELGNRLSGRLGAGRRDYQTELSEIQAPVRDRIIADRFYGTAAYRVAPDWRLRGSLAHETAERSRRALVDTEFNTATAGIDYVTPLGNALGLEALAAEGDAPLGELIDPIGEFINNDFRRREVAAVATYNPGAQLRFDGRIGRTRFQHSEVPERDFEGSTWRLGAAWLPGYKTILSLDVYKEIRTVLDYAASHALVDGVSFGPSWAPTAKLVFSARLVRDVVEYQGDPAMREETVRALRLAAGWEITRHMRLAAGLDRGERSSTFLGRDYEFTAWMANLRYQF